MAGHRKSVGTILLSSLLTTICAACGTTTRIVLPDDKLLIDCPGPELTGDPAIDLLGFQRSLDNCNVDKAALRAWRGELQNGGR